MPIEIPKDKWPGAVRTVTLGATAKDGGTRAQTVTVGGEKTMPFMQFEGEIPHRPVIAVEIKDRRPDDWSALLGKAWGAVMDDPAQWAKAAEAAGADLILLALSLTGKDGQPNTVANAGLWPGTSRAGQ
jgi:acetyl-CoA decarbonylase/synthase complex subunit delta